MGSPSRVGVVGLRARVPYGRAGASALFVGGAGRPHRGGLPRSGGSSTRRLAAHASHKGSRDHDGACRWGDAVRLRAGRGLRPGSRDAMQAQGTVKACPVRAHANVRRSGGPAWRRPGGSARPCGRVGCHAAALHGAIKIDGPGGRTFPVSPLCRVPKASHRRPAVGSSRWPGPAWPSCQRPKAPSR